jgi:dihydroorotase
MQANSLPRRKNTFELKTAYVNKKYPYGLFDKKHPLSLFSKIFRKKNRNKNISQSNQSFFISIGQDFYDLNDNKRSTDTNFALITNYYSANYYRKKQEYFLTKKVSKRKSKFLLRKICERRVKKFQLRK